MQSEDRAFTPEEGVDYGGRDQVPQRMVSTHNTKLVSHR